VVARGTIPSEDSGLNCHLIFFFVSSSIRILCVDDDRLLLDMVRDRLCGAGFEVDCISEPTRVVPRAKELLPDLILLDRNMPVLEGSEVMRSLQAFPETRDIPVAFLTATCTEDHLLHVLRMGAVDVMVKPFSEDHVQRIKGIIERLASQRGTSLRTSLWDNLRAVYRRNVRAGTLVLNPGTPFEGRIRFQGGDFLGAEYGVLQGEAAAAEMLLVEDGTWTFEEEEESYADEVEVIEEFEGGEVTSPGMRPLHAQAYAPSALVVCEDARYRDLLSAALRGQGFRVVLTSDPETAYDLSVTSRFDIALLQLSSQGLDGWGLLRRLREDHRTREIPVVGIKLEAELLDAFRHSRIGSHLLFEKHAMPETIAEGCHNHLEDRRSVLSTLIAGSDLEKVNLQSVGVQWLMRVLADFGVSGRLQAHDEWGSYRLIFAHGKLVDASTGISRKLATGVAAVAALTVARAANGSFTHANDLTPAIHRPQSVEAMLEQATSALNRLESQVTERWLTSAKTFVVDDHLYALYQRFAKDGPRMLARAICEQHLSPSDLMASGMATQQELQAVLRDLLRRRVIEFIRDA